MIDVDKINDLIKKKRSFRIGARGICVDCRYRHVTQMWHVCVPRAFIEMHCDEITVCDDVRFTVLEMHIDNDRICTGIIDLGEYDKVTEIVERI